MYSMIDVFCAPMDGIFVQTLCNQLIVLRSAACRLDQGHTLEIVSAGLHCSLRMSRQMLPWLFTLGW